MTSPIDSGPGSLTPGGKFVRAPRGALPVKDIGRLLLRCADRSGLVAAVTTFLASAGANIISLDQHSTEQADGIFMQRTVFHLPGLAALRDDLARDFTDQVAEKFGMDFRLTEAAKPKRVAIMASREDHCLLDLLWRNRRGDLDMSVAMVIANHPDLVDQVRPFGTPFICIPATKELRGEAERR
jgi:formyltetrahydrofolate deformylase